MSAIKHTTERIRGVVYSFIFRLTEFLVWLCSY